MTIFLAVILGNVLAWLVHGVAWWLRLHKLEWSGGLGCLCGFPLAFLSVLLIVPVSKLTWWLLLLWLVIIAIGLLQSRWLREEAPQYFLAIWSAFAEFVLALVVSISISFTFVSSRHLYQVVDIYGLSFWLTLLLLAIFRPLVVRYSQRFRNLIRPQRTKPTA